MGAEEVHEFVTPQKRGLIALPAALRKRYRLDEAGTQVEVTERLEDGVIELRPTVAVPTNQAWFWTDEWQAGEREVDEDIKAGRLTRLDGPDELVEYLDKLK